MTRVFKNRIDELKEQLSDQKDYIFFLESLNEDYIKRINKVIDYIINNDELYYGDDLLDEYEIIINILKGVAKMTIYERELLLVKDLEKRINNEKWDKRNIR